MSWPIGRRSEKVAAKRYKARVRLSNGSSQEVYVNADGYFNAKAMLEAQYGKGSVISGPTETK